MKICLKTVRKNIESDHREEIAEIDQGIPADFLWQKHDWLEFQMSLATTTWFASKPFFRWKENNLHPNETRFIETQVYAN